MHSTINPQVHGKVQSRIHPGGTPLCRRKGKGENEVDVVPHREVSSLCSAGGTIKLPVHIGEVSQGSGSPTNDPGPSGPRAIPRYMVKCIHASDDLTLHVNAWRSLSATTPPFSLLTQIHQPDGHKVTLRQECTNGQENIRATPDFAQRLSRLQSLYNQNIR